MARGTQQFITEKNEFLYYQIADKLEKQIQSGVLKAGDKLLSVRGLSKDQGISMSTAFQAYTQLENKGLIEARPKSGYYVKFTPRELPQAPVTKIKSDIRKAGVDEMIRMLFENLSMESVVRFSIAAPDISLLPVAKLNKAMQQAIRQSKNSCLNYEHVKGNEALRKQIARLAFHWGGVITAEDVITTNGCMEALVFSLKALTRAGDTVAVDSPTYFGIFQAMQSLGLKVLEIPNDPERGMDIIFLQRAIEKVKIKACLFVSNFNSPTGGSMSDENKKRLVKLLADKNIPLIEDDIYGELFFGKQRPRTCKSFDKTGNVLLCSSVSKSLAPGYRVGWVIPGKYKDQVLKMKLINTITNATPTQAAVAYFFENGRYEAHLRNLRKALHTNCLRYIQAITKFFPDDTKITHPRGGYVLWLELHKRVNAFEIFEKAMEHNISIAPGQIFSSDARYSNFIRLGFGIPYNEAVEKNLRILGGIIKKITAA
jgi:DNA-binding transcriptional MocR family regulator